MNEFIDFIEENFPSETLYSSFNIDYIRLEYFLEFIKKQSCKDILEIGPGFGFMASFLAYKGYNVVVIEHPDAYINTSASFLKDLAQRFGFEIIFYDIEFQEINLFKNFDLCYSLAVIEHLHHSPKKLLQIMNNSLKHDGLLYLDTPNAVNLRKRIYMLFGIYPYVPIEYLYNNKFNRSHIREYTAEDLYFILNSYGYTDISIKYKNCMNKSKRLKNNLYLRYSSWKDFLSLYTIYTLFTLLRSSFKDTLIAIAKKK